MSRSAAVLALVLWSMLLASAPARAAPSGYAAEFAGQSSIVTLATGETATLIVLFANTGDRTWQLGTPSQVDLAMCSADRTACDVRDADRGEWDPGSWQSASRYATQRQPTVARGQIATFVFSIRPSASVPGGAHRLPAELVLGATGERITTSTYAHEVSVRAAPLAPLTTLMLEESEVGAGFARVQDRPLTLDDRAAMSARPDLAKADLATWGYRDGARRWYSKTTTRGVHSVFHDVYRYSSAAGAQADLTAVRTAHAVAGTAAASISTVAEDSSSYMTTSTSFLGVSSTQVTIVSRSGAAVSQIFISAAAGELSLEYAELLASAQAAKRGWRPPSPLVVLAATPTPSVVGGVAFTLDSSARRQVYAEATIPIVDAQRIATAVDRDLVALEGIYARRIAAPVQLYAFANAVSMERGLVSVFGLDPAQAAWIAAKATGAHLPIQNKIVLNWDKFREVEPLATIRHELSHYVFQNVLGYPGIERVPAWFNEGIAESLEWTYGRFNWLALSGKYLARSSSGAGLLPSLTSMTTLEQFQTGTVDQVQARYSASSQAAAMIVNRVGYRGVVRLLEMMQAGTSFEAAFESVHGSPFFVFAGLFETAMRSMDRSPGIAAVSDTPRGAGGLYVTLHGFRTLSTVSVTINGAGTAAFTRPADVHGLATFFYLPGRVSPGRYTIDATDGSRSASLVVSVSGAWATDSGSVRALGDPIDAPPRPMVIQIR